MFNNQEKILLGKLFRRYIDSKGISTKEIEHSNLSSTSTLYAAMKSKIIQNDEFYLSYCKLFDHEFNRKENFDTWFSKYETRLLHSFDYYEEDKFEELYNEFKNELEDYKNSAIYHEYYITLSSLFNYYLKNEYLRLEEVYDYLDLIETGMFSYEYSLFLLDYMFRSNNNYIGNKELPEILVKKMETINSNHEITMYQKAFVYKYNSNFMKALDLFKKCYEKSIKNENKYKEALYLLAIYNIYRNVDEIMEEETSKLLLEIKDRKDIPKNMKHNINYCVGMQDFLNGRYGRSYDLLNENLLVYDSFMGMLFQCSICSRMNFNYPKQLFDDQMKDRYDYDYLNYFKMKANGISNEKLAKYVLNTLVKNKLSFEKYKNPYWTIFEYELHEMANKDVKLRKYYLEYRNLEKKSCKDA